MSLDLSIVIPVYNEVENLEPLVIEIHQAMPPLGKRYEILLVDDGSSDGSGSVIRKLCAADPRCRGLLLDRHHGQTAAFLAGFSRARGELVVTMDADLQNDPHDIGKLLSALPGHDAAIGVRVDRHDSTVRSLSSRIANRLRSWATGDGFADVGCSLKAYRREVLDCFPPYRGMHRFFATLAVMHGFSVVEVAVSHRRRHAGKSKYGILDRGIVALRDLLAVRWMGSRLLRHSIVEEVGAPEAPASVSAAMRDVSPARQGVP